MRRAAIWIASISFILGIGVLAITRAFSHDHAELYRAAATDFAISLIDVAITVGIVDFLLKAYSEHQRIQAIIPRVQELAGKLGALRTAQKRYLLEPSVGDLERYRRLAMSVQQSSLDLYGLLVPSNAILASDLLNLSHKMREHVDAVEDAILYVRNASADSKTSVEQLQTIGEHIWESSNRLTAQLAREYRAKS